MADTKSFSQYLAEAQKKVGVSTAGPTTNPWKSTKPVATTKMKSEPGSPGDFWSGLLSFLGSAKYAISNVPNQILNEQQKAFEAEKAGKQYDVLGGIGNVISSPVTGLVSGLTNTGPENKIDYAPLLEKASDVANLRNPNYKDVQNNVDAPFAGIVGFAGDVLLDPLTYSPGIIAKVGEKVGSAALKAGQKLSKAPKTSEEAAGQLRYSANVADTSPEAVAAGDALLAKHSVEDIKPAPAAIPKGTTTEISPATIEATKVEKGQRQASKAAANAETGVKAEAAFDYPTITQKIAELPTEVGGRPKLPALGNFIAGVRQGKGVEPVAFNKWFNTIRDRASASVRLGTATAADKKILEVLKVPATAKAFYESRYVKNFQESGGKVDLLGNPKASTTFDSVDGYVASLDDTADALVFPKTFRKPGGRSYMTGAEVKEAYVAGTIGGKPLTKPQLKEIKDGLAAGFDEAAASAGDDSFVARFKAILKENEAGTNNIFGKELASSMRKMSPARLSFTAKLLEDIASGSESLDNFIRYMPADSKGGLEAYSAVVKSLGDLLGVGDIAAYNLARRKALSEVNTAKREEYARLIAEGGDIEDFMVTSGVTSAEAKSVKEWFPDWLAKRVTAAKLELETTRKVKRTKDIMGQGEAYNIRELGTYDMWDLVMGANRSAIKQAKLRNLSGAARAEYVRTRAMTELAIAEKTLDNFGWPMWLGVSTKNSRFLASPTQVMSAMFAANRDMTYAVLFNGTTAGPYTFMADALTESLILGKPISRARLEEILLGEADIAHYGEINKKFVPPKVNGFRDGGTFGYGKDGKPMKIDGKTLIDMFDLAMPKMLSNLEDIIKTNSDTFTTRFPKESKDLSDEALKDMFALGADVTRMDRAIEYSDQLGQNIAAMGHESATLDLSILRATEVATGLVPQGIRTFARTTKKGQAKAKVVMRDVVVPPKANKATRVKAAKKADKEAEQAAQPAMAERLDDIDKQYEEFIAPADEYMVGLADEAVDSVKTGGRINAKFTSMMRPMDDVWGALASRFNRYYSQTHVANIWHSLGGTVARIRHNYTHQLKAIEEANKTPFEGTTTPVATKVFQDLQVGIRTPGHEETYDQLKALTAEVHDVTGAGNTLNDPFFQSQQGVETINEYLRLGGIDEAYHIDIDAAMADAKANGTTIWDEASRQWTRLTIDDPMQYLARRHAALMKMNLHIAVAHDFERMAFSNGMAWIAKGAKDVPPAGFVKAEGLDGFFFKFLPKDTYFDAMIMKELQLLSDLSTESRAIGGKLGDFINKYILPIQNDWKYAITLPRPGHHVRNGIGDASMTFQAEGAKHYMRSSRDAFSILAVNKNYEDIDLFNALRNKGVTEVPTQGDVLVTAKGIDITNRWAFDTMQKNGLLPSYHVGEDYVDDVVQPSIVSSITKKLTLRGGKIEETAGKFSEARDHWARAQHFMQIMRKHANDPKFKNIDELVEYASKRVKKFHPDSSMLTNFEAKYMRTLIPFYSWFRGALPALIEATALHPGRFMVFPKASYNLAYSMGINPFSVYDPFPDDQMFPSFLTEDATGPQFNIGGNYFGMNPGIASLDVGNQLAGGPLRGVAGMTSPLFRVPLELMSGGSWGTGARIKDPSDYVDASIPGVNYLSNVTGVSPTGSVASFLQGKGLDQQYQVDAGNKGPADQATSLMNWMTGLGFQNMSKPNYINYAEIEKRNQAAKDQRSAY